MPFFARFSNSILLNKKFTHTSAPKEASFLEPGVYLFTVPNLVTNVHAVAIGGGGSSLSVTTSMSGGGGGGGLGWRNNIPVSPGQNLVVNVGRYGNNYAVATWNTDSYEIRRGGWSYVGSYNGAASNCVSWPTAANVFCSSTAGIVVGQYVTVASGAGLFKDGTTVTSIVNSTMFNISSRAITNLSSASVYFSSNIYAAGYGGGYPGGYSSSSNPNSSNYYNTTPGSGGTYIGQGGGSGGSGGWASLYYGSSYIISGGGGGGAGGYSGNGGDGGSANGSDATNPTSGTAGSGGGGGGGAGGKSLSYGGYARQPGGAGGGVGIFGQGNNGANGQVELYHYTGRSGHGGSGGLPLVSNVYIFTTYPGANTTSGTGPYYIYASGANTFNLIAPGWVLDTGGPSSGSGAFVNQVDSNTQARYINQYSYGAKNSATVIRYYHSGRVSQPKAYGAGAGGGGNYALAGGGAVRIIWGEGRAFPNTNTITL